MVKSLSDFRNIYFHEFLKKPSNNKIEGKLKYNVYEFQSLVLDQNVLYFISFIK